MHILHFTFYSIDRSGQIFLHLSFWHWKWHCWHLKMLTFDNVDIWQCWHLTMLKFDIVDILHCWHFILLTFDILDIWHSWYLTFLTFDILDIWHCWHLTMLTFDILDIWHLILDLINAIQYWYLKNWWNVSHSVSHSVNNTGLRDASASKRLVKH